MKAQITKYCNEVLVQKVSEDCDEPKLFRSEARHLLKEVRKEWELKTGGFILENHDIQKEVEKLKSLLSGVVASSNNGKIFSLE